MSSSGHHNKCGKCGGKCGRGGCEKKCGCGDCKSRGGHKGHHSSDYKVIKWPPSQEHKDSYSHINVPGHFNNVQAAITAIEISQANKEKRKLYEKEGCDPLPNGLESPEGYVIHLAPGVHEVYTSHVSNLKFLRFEGERSMVKGVGYFHCVGNWEDYNTFNGEFDTCEGGEAPFHLTVDCNRITVNACTSPNYNSLRCGDKLTFFHRDGTMTNHQVKYACDNDIVLTSVIPIKGKCPVKGEGFFIHPNVTMRFCARHCNYQKMLIQHRIEYVGLNLKLANPLTTGATGGHSAVNGCTIEGACGSFIHVGKADWSMPNVWLNEMAFNDGTGGSVAMLQSFVGCKAKATFQSNPNTNFWFSIFNGNAVGLNLKNSGKASVFSSHFHSCNVGISALHGSTSTITKSQFSCNKTGVLAKHQSQINGKHIYEDTNLICNQDTVFDNNVLAIGMEYHVHTNLQNVVMSANTTDLDINGTVYANLSSYTSGEVDTTDDKDAVLFYDKIVD